MKKRRRLILILIGVAVLICMNLFGAFREREPKYEGKKLSEWVSVPNARIGRGGVIGGLSGPAQEAVERIGTNGLPLLMSWVRYVSHDPPKWRNKIDGLIMDINHRLHRYWVPPDYARSLRGGGDARLDHSRQCGESTHSRTVSNFERPDRLRRGSTQSGRNLARSGQNGIDSLLTSMTNSKLTALDMMIIFENLGTNAATAVPGLQSALRDPSLNVRVFATNALGQVDLEALERAGR